MVIMVDHKDAFVLEGKASIKSAARTCCLVLDNLNIETLGEEIPFFGTQIRESFILNMQFKCMSYVIICFCA